MQTITDNLGRVLGYYNTLNEQTYLLDKSFHTLGFYSTSTNQTHKPNGSPIGNGNLLAMLLKG